jgi:hypothetical protein
MCQPISWIERDSELLYLKGSDLETKRGRKTVAYCQNKEDLCGHGAIRYYFGSEAEDGTITPFSGGADKEITDFSKPSNFPIEIIRDIKNGAFCGVFAPPKGVLRAALYADFEKKRAPLDADFEKKRAALDADFEKKRAALDANFAKEWDALYADFEKKRAPLYADFEKEWDALYADFEKKRAALYANFEKKRVALDAKIWALFPDPTNRCKAWK